VVIQLDVEAECNGQSALDEPTGEHEPLFAWDAPTPVDYVANEPAKRPSPDVQ
jgi:hypothetical protein